MEVAVRTTTACDLDMFIHVPSQQMSRTYSEGEISSAYFEEAVSVKKSCICSRLVSLHSDGFGLFRGMKRPNIIYMLYAKCILRSSGRFRFCERAVHQAHKAWRAKQIG